MIETALCIVTVIAVLTGAGAWLFEREEWFRE